MVNEDEAEQVRAIFALYVDHSSLTRVVEELNRRGWRMKSWTTRDGKYREGGQWDRVSLRRLLTNLLYIGMQRLGDEVFEGEHDAIVPGSRFDKVQTILRENRSTGGAAHRNRHGALLRGTLRCATCDAPMTFAPTKKGGRVYRYYRCSASMKRGRASCSTGSIPADKIEKLVVDQIRGVGKNPELQSETFRQVLAQIAAKRRGARADTKRLTKQITSTETNVTKLVHTLTDAKGDARRAVSNELEKAQEHLRSLEARLAEVRTLETISPLKTSTKPTWLGRWKSSTRSGRFCSRRNGNGWLQLLIERVSYNRETEELRIDLSPAGMATLQRELDGESS